MFHQSSSRSPRSKGFKVKNIFQLSLFLIVVLWLLYQVKHSHDKKAEFASSARSNLSIGHGNSLLGRKGQVGYNDGISAKTDKVNYDETSERKQDGGGDDDTDRHNEEKVQDELLDLDHEKSQEDIMNVGKSNEQEWQSNEQGSEESQINSGDKENDQSEVENLKDGTEMASIKEHEEPEANMSAHDEKESKQELESNAESQINGGDKENDQSANELESSHEINPDSEINVGDKANDFDKQHEGTQEDISQHTERESEVGHAENEEINADSQSGDNADDQSTSEVQSTEEITEVASNKEHQESQEDISDHGEKESEKQREGYEESDADSQINSGNEAYAESKSTSTVKNSKEGTEEVFTNEHEESRDEVLDNDKSSKVEQGNEENNSGSQNNGGEETTDQISGENGNSKKGMNGASEQSNGTENDTSIDQNETGNGVNEFHDANGVPEQTFGEIKVALSSNQETILTSLNQTDLTKKTVQGSEESTYSSLPDQQNDIQILTNNEALRREAVESHGNSASEAETSDKNHPENVISDDELANSSLPDEQNTIPTDNLVHETEEVKFPDSGSSKAEATDNNILEDTNSDTRSYDGGLNSSFPHEQYIKELQTENEISGSEAVESQENGVSEAKSTGDSTPEDAGIHPKSEDETSSALGINAISSSTD